jgi:beta-glucosidase-like glycosyl hydrolase
MLTDSMDSNAKHSIYRAHRHPNDEVEDSVNTGVNMVFPCNEIQKTAWNLLRNFDHALILREDDPCYLRSSML